MITLTAAFGTAALVASLAGVAAEVVTNIYYHLRRESAQSNTILVSLTNGRLTYIPDDAAYDSPIFEVRASSLKRGCGENAIVNSFVDMINTSIHARWFRRA